MREALSDPELLGGELRGASWAAWRVLLIACVGEPLDDAERVIFTKLTGGREREPLELVEVLLIVAGRRSGKTKAMSVLSIYLSCFCDWSDDLSLGERGVCLFMAPTERMAMEAHRYSTALVDKIGGLRDLVDNRTQDTLTLKTGITIETRPANWRSARGFTSVAIVLDESAYLYSAEDFANPDIEILRAVKPTLATTGGPMLLTSSPASMQGIVFRLHKQHFGKDGDAKCLIVQSNSLELNPTLKRSVIDRAYDLDAEGAADAYSGEFREPLSAYLVRSIVEGAVEKGVEARPVLPGIQYFAFVDVAGGTGKDAYALTIGHRQGRDKIVIDQVVQTPPPFNPDAVTEICARWLKDTGVGTWSATITVVAGR